MASGDSRRQGEAGDVHESATCLSRTSSTLSLSKRKESHHPVHGRRHLGSLAAPELSESMPLFCLALIQARFNG